MVIRDQPTRRLPGNLVHAATDARMRGGPIHARPGSFFCYHRPVPGYVEGKDKNQILKDLAGTAQIGSMIPRTTEDGHHSSLYRRYRKGFRQSRKVDEQERALERAPCDQSLLAEHHSHCRNGSCRDCVRSRALLQEMRMVLSNPR